MSLPYCFELAVALRRIPGAFRVERPGVMIMIRLAVAFGWNDPIYGPMSSLVKIAVKANMQDDEARGKGSKAKHRVEHIEQAYQAAQDALAEEIDSADDCTPFQRAFRNSKPCSLVPKESDYLAHYYATREFTGD